MAYSMTKLTGNLILETTLSLAIVSAVTLVSVGLFCDNLSVVAEGYKSVQSETVSNSEVAGNLAILKQDSTENSIDGNLFEDVRAASQERRPDRDNYNDGEIVDTTGSPGTKYRSKYESELFE